MKRLWPVLGVLAALAAALLSVIYALLDFVLNVCGTFDDTGGPFPAEDSPQGRVCGFSEHASWFEAHAFWSIYAAGVVAVILVIIAWRWGKPWARILAVIGLFAMPLGPLGPLGMPSDTCSKADLRDPSRYCETMN